MALELDLDDDCSVQRHGDVGSHGGRQVRLTGYRDVVSVGLGYNAAQSRRRGGSEGDGSAAERSVCKRWSMVEVEREMEVGVREIKRRCRQLRRRVRSVRPFRGQASQRP